MKPFIKTETHRVQDALALLTFRREVRAKREAEDFLAAAERRANARRFAPQPAMPSAFGGLK